MVGIVFWSAAPEMTQDGFSKHNALLDMWNTHTLTYTHTLWHTHIKRKEENLFKGGYLLKVVKLHILGPKKVESALEQPDHNTCSSLKSIRWFCDTWYMVSALAKTGSTVRSHERLEMTAGSLSLKDWHGGSQGVTELTSGALVRERCWPLSTSGEFQGSGLAMAAMGVGAVSRKRSRRLLAVDQGPAGQAGY
jgi:hypothetical protein